MYRPGRATKDAHRILPAIEVPRPATSNKPEVPSPVNNATALEAAALHFAAVARVRGPPRRCASRPCDLCLALSGYAGSACARLFRE
jgi:hypothetical protein